MKNIRTRITIIGLKPDQADMLGKVFGGDAPFETLWPVPSSLKKCTDRAISMIVSDAIKEYLRKRPRDTELERPDAGQHIIDYINALGLETKGKTLDSIYNSIQAYRNTGYTSPEMWKKDRWGCTCEPSVKPTVIISGDSESGQAPSFEVIIDTKDSEPKGISRRLSCCYPDAEIIHSHGCINDTRFCARITYHTGKVTSRFYPDPLDIEKWTEKIYE